MTTASRPRGVSALFSALRLVHPFPSLINSVLVFGLAALAGGGVQRAAVLALGMLGLQFCIGTVNDLADEAIDRQAKPWKPIAAGIVSRRVALAVAIVSAGGGLVLAVSTGLPEALMAVAMLACGLVYDTWLKPTAWAWLCFSIAFAILPVYAWYGAVAQLPPRPEFLEPLAALAGPVIQLSNGLADLERDSRAGLATLATRLGRKRSVLLIAMLLATVHGLAWLTLSGTSATALAPVAAASTSALVGLGLSAASQPSRRELGWMVQAGSLVLLGLGWAAAIVS